MLLTDPEVESSLLISLDEGASYQKHALAFDILSLLFHPEQEDWILAYSHDQKVMPRWHTPGKNSSVKRDRKKAQMDPRAWGGFSKTWKLHAVFQVTYMLAESPTSVSDGEIGQILHFSCVKTPEAETEAAAGEAAGHTQTGLNNQQSSSNMPVRRKKYTRHAPQMPLCEDSAVRSTQHHRIMWIDFTHSLREDLILQTSEVCEVKLAARGGRWKLRKELLIGSEALKRFAPRFFSPSWNNTGFFSFHHFWK